MEQLFLEILGDRDLSQNCRASWNSISIIQSFLCAAPSCKVSYNAHSHFIYIYTLYIYLYIYIYICISTTVNYWSLITSPPLWPGFCLEIQTSGDVHSSTAPWPSSWPAIITKQFCGCEGLQEPRASYTPIHFPTTIKATTKGRNERTKLIPSHSTSWFLHTRNFRSEAGKKMVVYKIYPP